MLNDDQKSNDDKKIEMPKNHEKSLIVSHNNENIKNANLFDLTFGREEKSWMIVIDYTIRSLCIHNKIRDQMFQMFQMLNGKPFIVSYNYSKLNATYINIKSELCSNIIHTKNKCIVQYKNRKFYKEFAVNFESVNDGETVRFALFLN